MARSLGRVEQTHRRTLGALEHGAAGDGDAELEAEVDGQRIEIDEPHFDHDGADATAFSCLLRQYALQLGLAEPAVAD